MAALTDSISEAELQETITDALEAFGWYWFHDNDSRRNNSGFPDLIAVHPASHVLLVYELKSAKGRWRPGQREWLAAFTREDSHRVVRCVRPEDLDSVLREIQVLARPG